MKKIILLLLLFAFTSCFHRGSYKCTKEIKNETAHTIELTFARWSFPDEEPDVIIIKPYEKWTQEGKYLAGGNSHGYLFGMSYNLKSMIFDGNRSVDLSDPKNDDLINIQNLHYSFYSGRWTEPEEGREYHLFTFTEEDFNRSVPID